MGRNLADSFGEQICPWCGEVLYSRGETELPVCGKCVFCGKFVELDAAGNYCRGGLNGKIHN